MSRTPRFTLRFTSPATTRLLGRGALAVLLITGAGWASAQSSPPPVTPADHHARMAERQQQRLEDLKARLQLTPEQEPAWRAYVARSHPADRGADRPAEQRPDWASLTTPQRIERMKAWQAERQVHQQQRMQATLSFYDSLHPAQRQIFDQATVPPFMRAGMHRHGQPKPETAPRS